MAENVMQEQRPWFFNLIKDGDEAIVRILHSNTKTIERVNTHRIEVAGKKKRVKCNGDGCPLCTNGNQVEERIYLHLYDYTDNKEKVWDRTDKIIPQLDELFESWNPLNSAVVKIKRIGDQFPKYEITAQNPTKYADVPDLVDKHVANRFMLKRSNEDIAEFMNKGVFPERKPYVPKEEYFKQKQQQTETVNQPVNNFEQTSTQPKPQQNDDVFDPFADSIITKPKNNK